MDNSTLPLHTWLRAMYRLRRGKTQLSALMRHLGVIGVSCPAAWRMRHKPMRAMYERRADRQRGGIVQLDDACPGGERNRGKPPGAGRRTSALS